MGVRTVRYKSSQSGEDLFVCEETKKVYIRQPADNDHVRWLTGIKWSGGYEASCCMKAGLILRVVDKHGNVMFEETIGKEEGYSGTIAKKKAPLRHEWANATAKALMERFDVVPYEAWKAKLMDQAAAFQYNGYYENWCFWETVDKKEEKIQKVVNPYGDPFWVVATTTVHKICSLEWLEYDLKTEDCLDNEAIIGYRFIEK